MHRVFKAACSFVLFCTGWNNNVFGVINIHCFAVMLPREAPQLLSCGDGQLYILCSLNCYYYYYYYYSFSLTFISTYLKGIAVLVAVASILRIAGTLTGSLQIVQL